MRFLFDIAEAYQLGFQDAGTPVMEAIINFHNYVMIYLTYIIILVFWILGSIVYNFTKSKRVISHKFLIHGTLIELIWTITPALILVAIAYPSFKLIYLIDEVIDPAITIKAIGHQWYWNYELSDYALANGDSIAFDSYMIPTQDLTEGQFRLSEVDNRVIVPVNTHVRMIVTSADVIHCWAVPSLGVKVDAIPGRLNHTSFLANRQSVYYGACSEICGVAHSQMPIVVQAVSLDEYCAHIESLCQS
jgi:cytochrome c oxidase subunit 2